MPTPPPSHKSFLKRALITIFASVLVSFICGWFGLAYLNAYRCLHPPRWVPTSTPAKLGLHYEDVSFRATDGISLRGWFIPASHSRGVIILCHGYPGNRCSEFDYYTFLHRARFSLLTFDFRGEGQSGGSRSTIGYEEVRDALGAVDYLKRHRDTKALPIGILGHSMGAAVAIMAAAQSKAIKAVVADSSYANLAEILMQSGRPSDALNDAQNKTSLWFVEHWLGIKTATVSPLQAIHRINPRPLLLIHGLLDITIPSQDSKSLFAAAGAHKQLWLVPHATHCASYLVMKQAYEKRVVKFLQSALRA